MSRGVLDEFWCEDYGVVFDRDTWAVPDPGSIPPLATWLNHFHAIWGPAGASPNKLLKDHSFAMGGDGGIKGVVFRRFCLGRSR